MNKKSKLASLAYASLRSKQGAMATIKSFSDVLELCCKTDICNIKNAPVVNIANIAQRTELDFQFERKKNSCVIFKKSFMIDKMPSKM